MSFGYIKKTLAIINNRRYTDLQNNQLEAVKSYGKLSPLLNNQLLPYKYNCLLNSVLSLNAPKKISPNVHQIWFG